MPRKKSYETPNHSDSAAGRKRSTETEKRDMRRTLPAFCISLLALCCTCAHAQEKSDGDTNRPVSDKNKQSMFYKAQHQETGNMWDVWLHHHEDTYFLYYLANVGYRCLGINRRLNGDWPVFHLLVFFPPPEA